jgi:spermidine synthase
LLLVLVSLVYFVIWRRQKLVPSSVVALVAIGLAAGGIHSNLHGHFSRMEELARRNSPFGMLQVLHEKGTPRRFYLNDYLTQNTYDADQKKSVSMFTYMLHKLAHAYTPDIQEVLCIGLGVGIVPMQFAREGVQVDVVEINPEVVPLATKYFDFEPSMLHIHFGDGRYFLNKTKRRYDAIILDAFLGDSSPSHLMSVEAFSEMRRALKPNGTLVINSFGDFEPGQDFFTASLHKTLSAVFASVRIHNDGFHGNTMFVASDQKDLKMIHPPDFSDVHSSAALQVAAAFDGIRDTNPESGRVLRDDYNPVEFYDARNRERIRKQLALSVRDL